MNNARWILTFICVVSNMTVMAQSWSIPAKSGEMAFGFTVYIESVYQRAGAPSGVKDTISGTAFLISDSNKVYLVTAKHIITAALTGKNQRLANNSIFISTTWKSGDKGMKLLGLSVYSVSNRPYVFSSDKEDLAIISLQKNKYKKVLATMLKQDCKTLPIDSIDTGVHHVGESFFLASYMVLKNNQGNKERSHGIGPGKIKTYPAAGVSFSIDQFFNRSYNGAPLLLNDKIIGMLSNVTGVLTNADIVRDPYRTAQSGRVIKAAYILPLLRKLQQNENMPGY